MANHGFCARQFLCGYWKIWWVCLKKLFSAYPLGLWHKRLTGQALSAGKYESYTCGKMEQEEAEIAIVGTKGQVVIPQRFRKALKITSKTKLVVYRKDDKLVVTKLKVPELGEDLRDLFREIDKQFKGKKKPIEKEILEEIQASRQEKRKRTGA